MPIRILLADDHGIVRAGLRALLSCESDFLVVGEASDGESALQLAQELHPDVIVMDIGMPRQSGIEVAARLREIDCTHRVLILTMYDDKAHLREAMQAGAMGYVLKLAPGDELIRAIRLVAAGELYIQPRMLQTLGVWRAAAVHPATPLSPREADVLRLICRGYTNHAMAEELKISVRTVECHRARLMEKLNAGSRMELVRYARTLGLAS